MEAIGTLAGGIAHDFNNILSGILGFSSYLLSKVEPDTEIHRDLGMIEQAAVRGADLTNQLLSFTRQKHLPKAPVELNKLVQDVSSLLKRSISKKIELEVVLDQGEPQILADAGQLNQVIMNLALNSADALKDAEGVIRVETLQRRLNEREQALFANFNEEETYAVLTVTDNGPGIEEEALKSIFDPFFTTKTASGGTGLGLSIVYGIVHNHGGAVTVDSRPGTETCFRIYLPLLTAGPQAETADDKPAVSLNGDETILVIDDEQILRQMVSEVLKGYGYGVLTASGGREGLELYRESKGRIDLVLLDMVMPGMDGEETFLALKKLDPRAGILLTSGFTNESRYQRLIDAGALGMVHKPYKVQELLRKVCSICSRRAVGVSTA